MFDGPPFGGAIFPIFCIFLGDDPQTPGAGFARKAAVGDPRTPGVGCADRVRIEVKIRVSNGPLFHLVPATGRLLRGSGRGGLASWGLSRLDGARSGRGPR